MGTGRGPLPADLTTELQIELDALARLEGEDGVAPDYVRFCGHVARAQAAARAAIRAAAPPATSSAARRLPRNAIPLDGRQLLDLLHALESDAAGAEPPDRQLRLLGAAAEHDPDLLTRLAAAVLDDDAAALEVLARHLDVPSGALHLVGRLLAAPLVAEARHRRGPVPELDARSLDGAEAGRCPTCGSAPALAVLCRDDGRRRLVCGLCGENWLAPRLMCVACGARDQARLGVLSVHADDARWVETCDVCRRYLKTVDERRLPEDHLLVPRAEDVASLSLDIMADEAGYVRSDCCLSPFHETRTP
jgi:formate dehydrogenase accessory protein FdhE